MSDMFLAEIRIFPLNFAPRGWAMCNGQLLPIAQNSALFSLLGTTYGGNGTSNFALPNLQGQAPMHAGSGTGLTTRDLGETGGEETVTLLQTEMPSHTHTAQCVNGNGTQTSPSGAVWAKSSVGKNATNLYVPPTTNVAMLAGGLASAGGSQPHNNLMPFLTLNFCIALTGIFPARN